MRVSYTTLYSILVHDNGGDSATLTVCLSVHAQENSKSFKRIYIRNLWRRQHHHHHHHHFRLLKADRTQLIVQYMQQTPISQQTGGRGNKANRQDVKHRPTRGKVPSWT